MANNTRRMDDHRGHGAPRRQRRGHRRLLLAQAPGPAAACRNPPRAGVDPRFTPAGAGPPLLLLLHGVGAIWRAGHRSCRISSRTMTSSCPRLAGHGGGPPLDADRGAVGCLPWLMPSRTSSTSWACRKCISPRNSPGRMGGNRVGFAAIGHCRLCCSARPGPGDSQRSNRVTGGSDTVLGRRAWPLRLPRGRHRRQRLAATGRCWPARLPTTRRVPPEAFGGLYPSRRAGLRWSPPLLRELPASAGATPTCRSGPIPCGWSGLTATGCLPFAGFGVAIARTDTRGRVDPPSATSGTSRCPTTPRPGGRTYPAGDQRRRPCGGVDREG